MQPESFRGGIESGTVGAANEKGAAGEIAIAGLEGFFRGVDGRAFQAIAERGESGLGMIIDGEEGAFALDAAKGTQLGDALHGHGEDLRVGDASDLYAVEFAEGPGGVVVGSPLWIFGAPVLVVEKRVGDAGIGLVHANDKAPGGKVARGGGRRFWLFIGVGRLGGLLFFLHG